MKECIFMAHRTVIMLLVLLSCVAAMKQSEWSPRPAYAESTWNISLSLDDTATVCEPIGLLHSLNVSSVSVDVRNSLTNESYGGDRILKFVRISPPGDHDVESAVCLEVEGSKDKSFSEYCGTVYSLSAWDVVRHFIDIEGHWSVCFKLANEFVVNAMPRQHHFSYNRSGQYVFTNSVNVTSFIIVTSFLEWDEPAPNVQDILTQLEYAATPVVVVVDSVLDTLPDASLCSSNGSATSGSCTLRSAMAYCISISSTSDKCIITMPSDEIIFLNDTLGELVIEDVTVSITLEGNGCTLSTNLTERNSVRMLRASVSTSHVLHLTLKNLNVEQFGDGSTDGGAIYLEGVTSVRFDDVSFAQNWGLQGGSIYATDCSNVSISDSHFMMSRAESDGGAIYVDEYCDDWSITNTLFISNNASSGNGGAVCSNSHNNYMRFSGCVFTGNEASYGGGVSFEFLSNDIDILNTSFSDNVGTEGSSIYLNNIIDTVSIDNCSFVGDFVHTGVLSVASSCSDVWITNSVFRDNIATSFSVIVLSTSNDHIHMDGLLFESNDVYQGVVGILYSNSYVTIRRCEFRDNTGSAIYVMTGNYDYAVEDTTFTRNSCQGSGAVYVADNNTYNSFRNCTWTDNIAVSGAGGGLFFETMNNFLSIEDCRFYNNSADTNGGALAIYDQHYDISLLNCTFESNKAGLYGGNIYISQLNNAIRIEKSGMSSGMAAYGGGIRFEYSNSMIDIMDCMFQHNTGMEHSALSLGKQNTQVKITNCNFVNNSALITGSGGAIGATESNAFVEINDCQFIKNMAPLNGGAIVLSKSNTYFSLERSLFEANEAAYNGGAIFMDDSNYNIDVSHCNFTRNIATYDGGAVYVAYHSIQIYFNFSVFLFNNAINGAGICINSQNIEVFVQNSVFYKNVVRDNGGAVFIKDGNIEVYLFNNMIEFNSALYGGGISMHSGNQITQIANCTFMSNTGLSAGGAVYSTISNDNFVIEQCTLSQNDAAYGAAVLLGEDHRYFIMRNCNAYGNRATYGAAVYISGFNSYISIAACNITGNEATSTGGGIYSLADYVVVEFSIISENRAQIGAGMFFDTNEIYISGSNSYISIAACNITGNEATSTGGGIYSLADSIVVDFSIISENRAQIGAGMFFDTNEIYISGSNSHVSIAACNITGNEATSTGGGIYSLADNIVVGYSIISENRAQIGAGMFFDTNEIIRIYGSDFVNNTASAQGGGISATTCTFIYVLESKFLRNSGISGGAIVLIKNNVIRISESDFVLNNGSLGGAILSTSSVNVSLNGCVFDSNLAEIGGACYSTNDELLEYVAVAFYSNSADQGGALYLQQSDSCSVTSCVFSSNKASTSSGSAIWISDSLSRMTTNQFVSNSAKSGGGTVYWSALSGMMEPDGLRTDSNLFRNNSAAYGADWATEGIRIDIDKSVINVDQYSSPIPELSVVMQDYYDQTVVTESAALVEISILSEYLTPEMCYDGVGYITGDYVEFMVGGVANISELQAYCAPGYTLGLNVSTSSFCVESVSLSLTASFLLNFRECSRGEYYSSKACLLCANGTYSLKENADLSVTQCVECPQEAESCYGDQLKLKEGYWRLNYDATSILACPLDKRSCIGGWGTGNDLCAEGHIDALCAVCDASYFYNSASGKCEKCEESSWGDPLMCIGVIIVIASLLFLVVKRYPDLSPTNLLKKVTIQVMTWRSVRFENRMELDEYLAILTRRLQSRLKVYVVFYQIVSSLPFVLYDSKFPLSYMEVASVLNVASLTTSHSSLVGCSFAKLDYIDFLMIDTLYPIALSLCMWCVCRIHVFLKCRTGTHEVVKLQSNYFSVWLMIMYLLLPGISTTIFRTYSCQNVDPDNVEEGSNWYMRADYSVSCSSNRYFFGALWAAVMLVVYPIGIPFLFFVLLYRSRVMIKSRHMVFRNTKCESIREVELKPLRILYDFYKPERWWWELVETSFRLNFTGLLIVVKQGSATQVIVGIAVAIAYIKLYQVYTPYSDSFIGSIKELTMWQLFAVLLLVLIVKADFSDVNDARLGVAFIFAVFINLVFEMALVFIRAVNKDGAASKCDILGHNDDVIMHNEIGNEVLRRRSPKADVQGAVELQERQTSTCF